MVEELGLLGAKLLPSEGGQAEVLGGSPARLRTVPVRAPSPTPKAGKKGKAAERTADPQALAALELEWREQRKATLSLQLPPGECCLMTLVTLSETSAVGRNQMTHT